MPVSTSSTRTWTLQGSRPSPPTVPQSTILAHLQSSLELSPVLLLTASTNFLELRGNGLIVVRSPLSSILKVPMTNDYPFLLLTSLLHQLV